MEITSIEAFNVHWPSHPEAGTNAGRPSAWVRVRSGDFVGLGEASPMFGGLPALGVVRDAIAPLLLGRDPRDHGVLYDELLHHLAKLGPDGIATSAIAAVDIALWDLTGQALGVPVSTLLGGAWRAEIPIYSSIGDFADSSVQETVTEVARRLEQDSTSVAKIRMGGNRTKLDVDIPGDIAKATAVRELVGDRIELAFDGNNRYSVSGAIRVGRALQDLGYEWFEEPLQHYQVRALSQLVAHVDIPLSAGEQTYSLQGVRELIDAGVAIVQPDIIKMGGFTGLHRIAALADAHGAELVPHQTQPTIGNVANLHLVASMMNMPRPAEYAGGIEAMNTGFSDIPQLRSGSFRVPTAPGLGVQIDEQRIAELRADLPPRESTARRKDG
jgi:L-alanine-DL-glutamate epimerase-like enolase superfamily enzyme